MTTENVTQEENKDKRFYVYAWLDPRKSGEYEYGEYLFEYEPFYIGKGTGNRFNRKSVKSRKQKRLVAKVNKIENMGYRVIRAKISENLSEVNALNEEETLIKLIGRLDYKNGPLINLTDGGITTAGHIKTSEEIANHAKSLKKFYKENPNKHPRKGAILTKETKAKITASLTGKKRSKESCEKQANTMRGKSVNYKIYILLSPDGKKIRVINLTKFCKDNNLSRHALIKARKENRAIKSGWKILKTSDKVQR